MGHWCDFWFCGRIGVVWVLESKVEVKMEVKMEVDSKLEVGIVPNVHPFFSSPEQD